MFINFLLCPDIYVYISWNIEYEIQVVNKENILKAKSYNSMALDAGEESLHLQ
jgi:hypothetical protein